VHVEVARHVEVDDLEERQDFLGEGYAAPISAVIRAPRNELSQPEINWQVSS
jgi:hypothetical protein